MKSDGCCAASRWEILREAIALDSTMRELALEKYKKGVKKAEINLEELLYKKFVLNRSTSWIETACQVSLDRGCSRGLRRPLITLRITLQRLNYEKIFKSSIRSRSSISAAVDLATGYSTTVSNLLIKHLRASISDLLAIPIADVGEMRFWQGSILMEIVIDGGASAAEILRVGILRKRLNE